MQGQVLTPNSRRLLKKALVTTFIGIAVIFAGLVTLVTIAVVSCMHSASCFSF